MIYNRHTFTLNDKVFGFKLCKDTQHPTVSSITENGCLYNALKHSTFHIPNIIGTKLISVNDKNVESMSYDDVMKYIRSVDVRPVVFTFDFPNSLSKITQEQMDEQSKHLTEESLRMLVKSQIEQSDSSDYESEQDEYVHESSFNRLQTKLRNANMKIENHKIEYQDLKKDHETCFKPFQEVNELFCQISGLKHRFIDLHKFHANYTSKQLDDKQSKLMKEFKESVYSYHSFSKQIQLLSLKLCFDKYIELDSIEFQEFSKQIKTVICMKYRYEILKSCSLIVLLIAICFQMYVYA